MRRIFRDTTAVAVAFSLVLPTVGSAQRAAPSWHNTDAAGPDRLLLAQAGAPVVVIPADAAKADPRARQQAGDKAAAGKPDAAGKQDKAVKAAPEGRAKAALAEAAAAAKGREPARAQPAKPAAGKGKAPKAEAGKDAVAGVKAGGAKADEAKAAGAKGTEAARRDAEAQRNARAANEKAAKAKAAAEARDQAAERQAAQRQAAAARKAAAEADARAKAKARQGAAKAENTSAARVAAEGSRALAPVVVAPANPAPRNDAQGTAKADDKAPARAAAGDSRGPAPVVVAPANPAPRKDAQDAAKPDDRAPARAAAGDSRGPAPVVVTPAAPRGTGNAAPSPAGRTPEDIARALAERQGAGVVVTPAAPAADRLPATPRDQAAGNPAERAALAEARRANGTVPETRSRKTDAAREAAAMGAVPAAAAAALSGGAAPVVVSDKTAVTRENSRDATEDFATDLNGRAREALSDAAAAAAGDKGRVVTGGAQPRGGSTPVVVGGGRDGTDRRDDRDRRRADGDDDSDLENALKGVVLPALAGMVVGRVLSNNRSVALNTGDRVVVTHGDGSQELIKDDNALLMRPGSTVQSEQFADGSSRTIVTREDGSQVVTIRDADLRVLRRSVVHTDGRVTPLIDETAAVRPVDVASLPAPARPVAVLPDEPVSDEALRAALSRETSVGRTFTLGQIRNIPEVRALVAPIDIQSITFDTGSAAISPDQAQSLASLGRVLAESVRDNPAEMFLIEGHTDAVGGDAANLALSDRRAESVALALTEFFQVPPENMVVQGYGEAFPKIEGEGEVRANRRATVRRITDLLARN